MTRLEAGDTAPDFTLPESRGGKLTLSGQRGKRVILYFYPEAGTPGCTTEACDFRDNLAALESADTMVIGVSRDAPAELERFGGEHDLPFSLVSDADRAVHESYGAWGEKSLYGKTVTGVIRSTFVIDRDGRIEHALYNVKATGHVAALKKRLGIAA